jgi:glycerophosphoryl diester phosphodiesterase
MKKLLRPLGFGLALGFLALTFINASWIAPSPRGYLKLVAHRGVYQLYDRKNLERDTCTADRIEPPLHDLLENTLPSMLAAGSNGAQMVEVDIALTKDGKIAVFHDWTLDCRTNGTGETRDHTMAELKALDAGYGYTADGGKTFPFRGKGMGLIPSLEDVLRVLPEKPILFNFKSKDPAEADALAAALKAAGRAVETIGDGFYGNGPNIARIRTHFPKAWAFNLDAARACTKAYGWQGWLGLTPSECKGGTIMVPLNYQWAFAGWPNRLIARMEAVGAKVVLVGLHDDEGGPVGLYLPEQIRDVPAGFNGYLWVDDIYAVGPAVRPQYGKRNPVQEKRFEEAMERRRAARE